MNYSNEAAEIILKMSLDGAKFFLEITGTFSKNLLVSLYALSKDTKKTKGKIALKKMLRSQEPLKIFTIKEEELYLFQKEAKRYGILYTVLVDKDEMDGEVDIITKCSDAARINRVVERFKLNSFKDVSVKTELEMIKENPEKQSKAVELENLVKDISSPGEPEQEGDDINPNGMMMEKDPLSENSSKISGKGTNSVRENLKNIREELEKAEIKEKGKKLKKDVTKQNPKIVKNKNGDRISQRL